MSSSRRMEDPGVLQSMGSQRARSDLVTEQQQIQFYIRIIFFKLLPLYKVMTVDVDMEMYERPRGTLIQENLKTGLNHSTH